ncbi:hypothetical protein, variant [Fonticula alba]|nr:hypothetical protein, variant [Fonticula alba]KCV69719.1 hypothetical protein, variant [Fonticula alba]|eukprot:XP_009496284.1 hypothetical protein, variant [Fonticula alba]
MPRVARDAGASVGLRPSSRAISLDQLPSYLAGVHQPEYIQRLLAEAAVSAESPGSLASGDLYLSPGTPTGVGAALGTLLDAVDLAAARGRSPVPLAARDAARQHLLARSADVSPAPGPEGPAELAATFALVRPPGHHCTHAAPMGFCFFNNAVAAARHAFTRHGIEHIAIIDFDLHHGNGTQDLVVDINQKRALDPEAPPRLFFGSLHDIKSYPCELYDAAAIFSASICLMDHDHALWNVHLQPWADFGEFLGHYDGQYRALLTQAAHFLAGCPPDRSLIIVSAGFDAHELEYPSIQRQGRRLPAEFYYLFCRDLALLARAHTDGKMVFALEGGYSQGALANGLYSALAGLAGLGPDHATMAGPGRMARPSRPSDNP